uniref:Secreted protein n=1 Tax=Triticum urartu TaxID=4572 RepID=A0A8R7QPY2_TRIUA
MYMCNWISCCSAPFVRILVCLCLKKLSVQSPIYLCCGMSSPFSDYVLFSNVQLYRLFTDDILHLATQYA